MRACAVGLVVLLGAGSAAMANLAASSVVSYEPGSPAPAENNTNAAIGLPVGDTGWGAISPFNPAYSSDHLLVVREGGQITLQLSQPVTLTPQTKLGVYANVGIIADNGGASSPPGLFNTPNRANLYVSADNVSWTQIGGGTLTFDVPYNAYTDSEAVVSDGGYVTVPVGNVSADYYKPFMVGTRFGNLDDFAGKNYGQMLTLLDGAAGGSWFDLSSVGLSQVQYVKFEVPNDAIQMGIDAVVVTPEPATLGVLVVAGLALVQRRRRPC